MVKKMSVVLVDDLDGSEAVETVAFSLDRSDFEIDLSADNAERLRSALAEFVACARTPGARGGWESGEPSSADIRHWGRQNGWEVPARGRVGAELRAAFEDACRAHG